MNVIIKEEHKVIYERYPQIILAIRVNAEKYPNKFITILSMKADENNYSKHMEFELIEFCMSYIKNMIKITSS